jgi:phosphoglucomutase
MGSDHRRAEPLVRTPDVAGQRSDVASGSSGVSPSAGKPPDPSTLVDVPKLEAAYFEERPDPGVASQRVAFGTSGHRGSAFDRSFNEWHILAITQAICDYRAAHGITGPLFIGRDTHALSGPAWGSAVEVLAANRVDVMASSHDEFTPTPVVSHAILGYNRGRRDGLADGIVVTPSHNPPEDGGFKYDPPHGGPADGGVTSWIETRANDLLAAGLTGVTRMPLEAARRSEWLHRHDYLRAYVDDLGSVVDLEAVSRSGLKLGVDPLGGAGVHYWAAIAERWKLDLTVVSETVDPTFRFMTLDWDGRIRMDPSSPYAMKRLVGLKDRFDVAFACDTDHDRHGVVSPSVGLLPPNHYLSVCIHYLFPHRPEWSASAGIGKTVVSSTMIDRVAAALGRALVETPVGFKWFVDGLLDGTLAFGGEESAGAAFARRDGTVWTTDKDGITAALLAAEITAVAGKDPGDIYRELTRELGDPVYERVDAQASPEEKARLAKLSRADVEGDTVAGEPIVDVLTTAPGNGRPIGGIKVSTANGWFAARPSGTEDVYKIYAESFLGSAHLRQIQTEARVMVAAALARRAGPTKSGER